MKSTSLSISFASSAIIQHCHGSFWSNMESIDRHENGGFGTWRNSIRVSYREVSFIAIFHYQQIQTNS